MVQDQLLLDHMIQDHYGLGPSIIWKNILSQMNTNNKKNITRMHTVPEAHLLLAPGAVCIMILEHICLRKFFQINISGTGPVSPGP